MNNYFSLPLRFHTAVAFALLVHVCTGHVHAENKRECLDVQPAGALDGNVIGIQDGDTFDLLTDAKHTYRIRLAEVDAPESGQDFGGVSKQGLASLVFNRPVAASCPSTDCYGRQVCQVFVEALNVNLAQVQGGLAWSEPRYVKNPQIKVAQSEAQISKRGLWSMPAPVPPWEFRRAKKNKSVFKGEL